MRVLYLSYDGILEPLGQSQVVSYLTGLAGSHTITLISYEKGHDLKNRMRLNALKKRLTGQGIRWIALAYHKRPTLLATAWDIAVGIIVGSLVCIAQRIQILHARGYVPSAIALCLKRLGGKRFLFDMRGFWADEKLEAEYWTKGSLAYRLAKRWERRFFEQADAIVSLTHEGVKAFPLLGYSIPRETPVEVIPTCVDLGRFTAGPKEEGLLRRLGRGRALLVGSVGTLSGWYLRAETLSYLAFLVKHLLDAHVLFVTREDHAQLLQEALAYGLSAERVSLARADFDEMPSYLRLMDLGVFFIKPCFSKKGSAATKLAEFLATGVPVILNDGVGDSGELVRKEKVGVVLEDFHQRDFEESLRHVKELLSDPTRAVRCREAALRTFDLTQGVRKYAALYKRLCNGAAVS